MSRLRGGYIGHNAAPAASAANSAASGVWTLREAEALKRAGTWPSAFLTLPVTTGLQLHLDASDSTTLFSATTGGSLVEGNGGVARWQDKSGNARHATQGTSGSRPLRTAAGLGGRDVLRFDGSNDLLNLSTGFRWWPQGTFFAVLGNAFNSNIWYAARDPSDEPEIRLVGGTTSGFLYYSSAYQLVQAAGHYDAIGTGSVRTISLDGSAYKSFSNGTLKNSSTLAASGPTNNPTDIHTLGAFTPENPDAHQYAAIDIAEIIIYNSALSDADRSAVESYLMSKWGIS